MRWEELAYHADGKLASITEFGVGGSPSRTWELTWDGDDLTHVLRPDGTTWVMGYSDDPDLAGYLVRLALRPVGGTSSTDRVEAAWEYDAEGNVVKVWRGAESYDDPLAVDRWSFSFDDPVSPTETVVTDPLGDEATYVLDRDPAGEKPRVRQISGDCPTCSLRPNSTLDYGVDHPLLPSSITDGNGNLEKVWDANHPSLNQTNPPTATYAYDALDRLTSVIRPWTGAGGGDAVTTYGYDLQDHLISVEDAEGNTTLYTYSDRDLLMREDSPVSGVTTRTYNQHGELETTTDARSITVTRTVDALDRVTAMDYPDPTLDTTYDYDDPLVAFSEGRLTAITRDGHTVAYEYDRFGRTTRDGELTLTYDKNGNRTGIGYPGGVTATYGFDFADREIGLDVTTGAGPSQVVDTAAYLPAGPLTALTFGTGATESRLFDARYVPESIALDAAQNRSWTYDTDPVGNVTDVVSALACPGDLLLSNQTVTGEEVEDSCAAIEAGPDYTVDTGADVTFRAATRVVLKDGFSVKSGASFSAGVDLSLSGDVTRSYQYQDVDYFLADATGPWGTRFWTYDQIGNRLTETDFDGTDSYSYAPSGGGGNTPLLELITLPTLGDRELSYSPAGHQIEMDAGANVVSFSYDDAGRLCEATRTGGATTPFLYDGRSFLRHAGDLSTTGTVEPLYDSAGLLHGLLIQPSAADPQTRYLIFHVAGRPVAQLALETAQPDRWWYLTTDHLGTPLVATDSFGAELWDNRFEPFGRDMDAGLPWGALESEMFLRFPGQWEAQVWQGATMGAEVVYNVYRWYQPGVGRYTRTDPVGIELDLNLYRYAVSNPLRFTDPDGRLITPLPFLCAYFVGKDAQRQGQTFGWRWAHCWASCVITKDCGGAAVASRSGVVKELLDLLRCGGEILRTRSRSGPYCESAFQPSDFDDNETGIECPEEVPCEEHCRPFINKPAPPGPFFAPRQ